MRELGPWRTHNGELDPDAKTRMGKTGGGRESERESERESARNGKDEEQKERCFWHVTTRKDDQGAMSASWRCGKARAKEARDGQQVS